jgi:ethanolamine utilization protein EutN
LSPDNRAIFSSRVKRVLLSPNEVIHAAEYGVNEMFIAKVAGSMVATQKAAAMVGHKLMLVEPFRIDANDRTRLVTTGRTFVAVDTVGAGEGEYVLITQGSSARQTPETKNLPIDTVIVGIIDTVNVEGSQIYNREK